MSWVFDQAPEVMALSSRTVVGSGSEGNAAVLVVCHYAHDHSWAFLDGGEWDSANAVLVRMQTIIDAHPSLTEIADLPPGWSASRADANSPWIREEDPEE